MNKKSAGLAALGLAVSVGLSACGAGDAESNGDAVQVLTIAIQEDVRSPDNVFMGGTTTDRLMLGSTVYEPLFTSNEEGGIEPALATEASASDDLRTWTLTLRDGVTFSNGKDFTSADVVANFEAFMDPDNGSTYDTENIDSVEADGDLGVVVHLKEPDARWDTALQDTVYFSDLDARETGGMLEPGEVPIGTGPYVWSGRETGSSVTFTPNEDYWRGEPPLQKVIFKAIPDGQTAVIALDQGEVDMIANYVPPQALPNLEKNPDVTLVKAPGSTYYHAFLNFEKERQGGYEDGAAVRQGLAHLMNTEEIIPGLIGDFGELATQPIPPWQPGFDENLQHIAYDEAEGERLLAEGGINKGDPIDLLALRDRPFLCDWATAVQSNLIELGYDAQLECLDSAVAPDTMTKYKWDLLFWRNSGRANAAVMYQQRFGIGIATPPTDTYTLQDPELQKLINRMMATEDESEYAALGADVAQQLVTTDVATIPGYFDNAYFPVNNRVKGFTLSPSTWYGILYTPSGAVTTD
jgi:peptide/nickel transport system substrate-binding protein